MIKAENYPKSYTEVYEILKHVNKEDLKKIPREFIMMIKNNRDNYYEFRLEQNKNLEEQFLMRETKAILAYIFLNYWSTYKQKERIEKKFKQEIYKQEELKKNQYSIDVLKNRASNRKDETENMEKKNLYEYKKENFIVQIFNEINSIFKKIWKK